VTFPSDGSPFGVSVDVAVAGRGSARAGAPMVVLELTAPETYTATFSAPKLALRISLVAFEGADGVVRFRVRAVIRISGASLQGPQLVSWTPGVAVSFSMPEEDTTTISQVRRMTLSWTNLEVALWVDDLQVASAAVGELRHVSPQGMLPNGTCVHASRGGVVLGASSSCLAFADVERLSSPFVGAMTKFEVLGWPAAAALLSSTGRGRFDSTNGHHISPPRLVLNFVEGRGGELVGLRMPYSWPNEGPGMHVAAPAVFEIVGAFASKRTYIDMVSALDSGSGDRLPSVSPSWCTVDQIEHDSSSSRTALPESVPTLIRSGAVLAAAGASQNLGTVLLRGRQQAGGAGGIAFSISTRVGVSSTNNASITARICLGQRADGSCGIAIAGSDLQNAGIHSVIIAPSILARELQVQGSIRSCSSL